MNSIRFMKLKGYKLEIQQQPQAVPEFEVDFIREFDDIPIINNSSILLNGVVYVITRQQITANEDGDKIKVDKVEYEAIPSFDQLRKPTEDEIKKIREDFDEFRKEMIKKEEARKEKEIYTPGKDLKLL